MLTNDFFDRDPQELAQDLLGKVLRAKYKDTWLEARIVETEAYYITDKASHSSLGLTEKRRALFMSPGTIYMYYSRGKDSLNVSARGEGNAVLIKAGIPYQDSEHHSMIKIMRELNPPETRPLEKLCAGQTLLCRSLGLKVTDWNQKNFHPRKFYIADDGYHPHRIIQTTRLGIPPHRDPHLPYRFIDFDFIRACTRKPVIPFTIIDKTQ